MSAAGNDGVTVIVPSRNHGSSLVPTVASVLAQAPSGIGVLVVDDGSTDDAPADLVQLRDPRVRVVCQPRRGLARTLNLALALAETRWTSVLLPGDVLVRGWHAHTREAAVAQPSVGVVFVGADRVDERGGRAGAGPHDVAPASAAGERPLLLELLETNAHPFSGTLFDRRLALGAGAFDPTLRIALDHDLWLRLLPHCGAVALAGPLVVLDHVWDGGGDPAATAAERAHAVAKALASLRSADWCPGLRDHPADEAKLSLDLARRVLRSGNRALLGNAAVLAERAVAAGLPLPDDDTFRPLRELHPGLAAQHADRADVAGAPELASESASSTRVAPCGDESTVLRVAFEVASLDRGGLESVVARLALGLRARGVVPLVVCTEAGGVRAEELRRAGVDVVVLRRTDRERDIEHLLGERRIQLLNAHFSYRGVAVAARLGIPVVVTLHNAYAWLGSGLLDEVRRLDGCVAAYVAVSRSVAEFTARRFAIDPQRITVIRNGVDESVADDRTERAAARRALGVAEDAMMLVQVGRIDPIKSQLALVAAMAALAAERPQLIAWLVGGVGNPSYALRTERRIRDLGLAGRVVLAGERDDVPRILAAADVFVMPSVLEGLSLAALEAMSAGLPVVLTRTGDAPWLLGEDSGDAEALPGALVDGPVIAWHVDSDALNRAAERDEPEHAGRLAAALAQVLDDLPRFRERARARAAELAPELSLERQLAAHAALFASVAASGGARGLRALARDAEVGAAHAARRAEAERRAEDSLWLLAGVLLENLAVRRVATSIARSRADLESSEIELAAALTASTQALDKLRIGRRVRGAVRGLVRRLPGWPS